MFATATSLCCSAFLLGILFTSSIYDSSILFGKDEIIQTSTLAIVEAYYLSWWNGAVVIKTFLHVVFLTNMMAVASKVAQFSDETIYFSGGSLLLLIFVVAMYITVTVPYIRAIARDPIVATLEKGPYSPDLFTKIQDFFSRGNSGPLGDHARKIAADVLSAPAMTVEDRTLHVSVLCAANTIIITLLLGVILLQVGEWYVITSIIEPIEEEEKKLKEETKSKIVVAAEKKTQ